MPPAAAVAPYINRTTADRRKKSSPAPVPLSESLPRCLTDARRLFSPAILHQQRAMQLAGGTISRTPSNLDVATDPPRAGLKWWPPAVASDRAGGSKGGLRSTIVGGTTERS